MAKLKSRKTSVKTEAQPPKIKATIVSKSTGTAVQPSYNYSQGMIIFALVLAIIVAFGIYVWQQSALLNQQYQAIESSLLHPQRIKAYAANS